MYDNIPTKYNVDTPPDVWGFVEIGYDCPTGVPEEPWTFRAEIPLGVPEEPW